MGGQGDLPVGCSVERAASPGRLALRWVDSSQCSANDKAMSEIIYPRSPRETMCGWMHLPRYIDKIRLHLAGKLHKDYQDNLGKGFDAAWLEAAGLTHEQFIDVVKGTLIDAQVADWVLKNVKKPDA